MFLDLPLTAEVLVTVSLRKCSSVIISRSPTHNVKEFRACVWGVRAADAAHKKCSVGKLLQLLMQPPIQVLHMFQNIEIKNAF